MQVTPSQATSMIAKYIQAKIVPMLTGSPGMGKSAIVKDIAKTYGLKLIDLRLSQCDPTDLMGFPSIQGTRAGYLPMETFPLEGDPIPEGYNGWLLFLDEFNSASIAVQAAGYKLVLDRMVGQKHLHKHVAIVCAGNLETDGAIVNPMSTAMQSRLAHLELMTDVNQWLDWAYENGIHRFITSYIKFKPGNLYAFSPDHTDKTYACSRTWEFANRVLEVAGTDDKDLLPMLAGVLSEGVAREFVGFTKIDNDLPKISQIVQSPDSVRVPDEPSVLFALTGSISHHADKTNLEPLITYVKRLPKEFQVVALRETVRRRKELVGHPAMQEWASSANLF